MNKKTIIALLLVISVIIAACGQKAQVQQPVTQADADQPIDLGEGMSDPGTLGTDLNVDDSSSDTDAAVNEIQNI